MNIYSSFALVLKLGSSQGLAPRTEWSQPSWTHQGQGLHAAKAEATAKKTGLNVVTEEAQVAGYALLISMMICICNNATLNGFANYIYGMCVLESW